MGRFASETNTIFRGGEFGGGGRGGGQGSWNSGGRYGGRYGSYGGGGGGGRPVRMPGKNNIVKFRIPELPKIPKFDFKLPRPRLPQIPRMPHKFNLPNGIIPSFSKEKQKKIPKDFRKEPKENSSNTSELNKQIEDLRKSNGDIQIPSENNSENLKIPNLPKSGFDHEFAQAVDVKITVTKSPQTGSYQGIDWSLNPPTWRLFPLPGMTQTYVYNVSNCQGIRMVVSTPEPAYFDAPETINMWQYKQAGQYYNLVAERTIQPNFRKEAFDTYSGAISVTVELIGTSSGVHSPNPWKDPNKNKQDEEEMKCCNNCQAAMVIRSMQRTITVDSTAIVPSPIGGLIVSPVTMQKPMRVFALPGTEDAIKQQFNLIDEIRKRLAKTFNQSRMTKVLAKLQQIMSVTDFVLNVHNALMLTEDIVQTFFEPIFGAFDTVAKVLDDAPLVGNLFDLDEAGLQSGKHVAEGFESAMKNIFGVQGWAEIKMKWASFNNIIRGAAMQIQAAKDIGEAQKDLSEMTAGRLGKLHNKLAKAGVLFDGELWEEKVNRRWAWMYKLEDAAENNAIVNTAQFVQSYGSQILDIKEQKKEQEESRAKFQTDLQADIQKLTGEKQATVTASTGANYTRPDANPPETNIDAGE